MLRALICVLPKRLSSSPRKRGPMNTAPAVWHSRAVSPGWGLWVPASAGTTPSENVPAKLQSLRGLRDERAFHVRETLRKQTRRILAQARRHLGREAAHAVAGERV